VLVKSKLCACKVQLLAVGDSVAGAGKVQGPGYAPDRRLGAPCEAAGHGRGSGGVGAIPPIGERRGHWSAQDGSPELRRSSIVRTAQENIV
jgi:hypothetical protein